MPYFVDYKFQIKAFLLSIILMIIQIKPLLRTFTVSFSLISSMKPINSIIIPLLFLLIIIFLHESIHGVMYKLLGGRVKIKFLGINPYLIDVSNHPFSSLSFSLILLSPLLSISLLSLMFSPLIGNIIFYINLFSSSGDILLTHSLLSYSKDSYFLDRTYGYFVYKK